MNNQAVRKPKFLEEVDTTSNVIPLAFTAPTTTQDNAETVSEKEQPSQTKEAVLPGRLGETKTPSFMAESNHDDLEASSVPPLTPPISEPAPHPAESPSNVADFDEESHEEMAPKITSQVPSAPPPVETASTVEVTSGEETMGINENIATEKMIRLVEQLKQANHRLAEEARSTALEIGFQVAQRILEKEVAGDVSAMMSLVRSALRESGDAKILRLSLHPKDHQNITKALEDGQFREISLTQLELVPDAALDRGDVLVATDFGQIDGRVQTRLKEIKTSIDDSNEGEPYGTL